MAALLTEPGGRGKAPNRLIFAGSGAGSAKAPLDIRLNLSERRNVKDAKDTARLHQAPARQEGKVQKMGRCAYKISVIAALVIFAVNNFIAESFRYGGVDLPFGNTEHPELMFAPFRDCPVTGAADDLPDDNVVKRDDAECTGDTVTISETRPVR